MSHTHPDGKKKERKKRKKETEITVCKGEPQQTAKYKLFICDVVNKYI